MNDVNKILPWIQMGALVVGGVLAIGEIKAESKVNRTYYDTKFEGLENKISGKFKDMDNRFVDIEKKQDQKLKEFSDLRLSLGEKIIVLEVTQEGIVTRVVDIEKKVNQLNQDIGGL